MTAQDTIPEDISTAAYNLGVDIRHHIAHSRRELFEHDPDIDLMIAKAILAERQRDQWQPIDENTPHHRNVLVWREDAGEPWVAQYTDETFFDAEAGDSDRMDWFDLAGRYEGIEAPTHWQPLPVGPKGGEA